MRFDLATLIRRPNRRRIIAFRPVIIPKAHRDGLTRIMLRMLAPWDDAAARIRQAYANELARVLRHDSAGGLADGADDIADEVNRLVLELTPDLRDWALRSERIQRGKWGRAIHAAMEVTVDGMMNAMDMRETIEQFLVRSTSLIRDVNEQARGRIADSILRGIQQRTPTVKVAREIVEATGMARARARRIAAHQSVNLSSALNRERRRQAGLAAWRWRHSGKKHPRIEHLERDGNLYTDDPALVGTIGKDSIAQAPNDLPGVLPNCGCTEQAVMILEGEILG